MPLSEPRTLDFPQETPVSNPSLARAQGEWLQMNCCALAFQEDAHVSSGL